MSDKKPEVAAEPAAQAETLWQALATDLFNLVLGDFEWVRAQGGRHNVCPLCRAVSERDGGPGHQEDCPRFTLARRFDEATAATREWTDGQCTECGGFAPDGQHQYEGHTSVCSRSFVRIPRATLRAIVEYPNIRALIGTRLHDAALAALRVDPKAETPDGWTRREEALSEVIWWMLGERDALPPMPEQVAGAPRRNYWWRRALRERFDAVYERFPCTGKLAAAERQGVAPPPAGKE